ncbi:MAG: glycosyltransferase [Candidatus Eisenbacteria bacterium]|nr:glycosyltransferase [Candidatus Eisenbacteria bacterium]
MIDRQYNFDIICLSTNHWTGLPTSKQHLMSVLAASRRVLYVDPPTDLFSALGRRRRWAKFLGLRQVQERLWVLSPIALSVASDPDWAFSYYERLSRRILLASARLGLNRPVVWSFAPEHAGCSRALAGVLSVYQAADEPATKSRNPARTTEIEREHIRNCDIVFVVSETLLRAREQLGNVHRLPNAADRRHYARVLTGDPGAAIETFAEALRSPRLTPREFGSGGRPSIVFGGAAYGWFDVELLTDVAASRPDWDFLLVGPLSRRLLTTRLPGNVTAVGRRSYDDFVWYVASADVGILPLREGESARNCDPIVMYEFLLCGKPMVATDFPAAREHGTMVRTATGAAAFTEQIEQALEVDATGDSVRARMEFGFSCTWEERASEAVGHVAALLESRTKAGGGRS